MPPEDRRLQPTLVFGFQVGVSGLIVPGRQIALRHCPMPETQPNPGSLYAPKEVDLRTLGRERARLCRVRRKLCCASTIHTTFWDFCWKTIARDLGKEWEDVAD